MTDDARPVVVAYDGSEPACAAVRAAADLFPDGRIVVVTVWEAGLALATAENRQFTGMGNAMPGPDEWAAVDRAQRDHAAEAAAQGVQLAAEAGVTAEACSLEDEHGVARTIATYAEGCDARAVVVGSRGIGGMRARVFGSTSRGVLERADRPVVVVKAPG
jgi:nucleotide-binding universal stress UspA family protein